MYFCRLAVLNHVSTLPRNTQSREATTLIPYLKAAGSTYFASLTLLKAMAHSEVVSTARPPLIVPSEDPLKIEVNGSRVSLYDIRNVYKRALQRCREIQERLLLGLRLPTIRPNDDLSDERPGRGIKGDKDEGIDERIKASLLTRVLTEAHLRRRFISNEENGVVEFNGPNSELYLEEYDEYIENLLVLVHIGSGMPARATELTTLTRQNGNTSLRGLYVSHGRVFTMSCYSKTRSVKGLNTPIARFLNEEASSILLIDNLVIRPFAALLAENSGFNTNNCYLTDVFVQRDGGIGAEKARRIFTSMFTRYSGRHVTFGQYRHVAKYFANLAGIESNLFPDGDDFDDPSDDHDFDLSGVDVSQFGHSRQVSDQSYGLVKGEHSRLREHFLITFNRLSRKWHDLITPRPAQLLPAVRPPLVNQGNGQEPAGIVMGAIANNHRGREVEDDDAIELHLDLEPLPVRIKRFSNVRPKLSTEVYVTNSPRFDVIRLLKDFTDNPDAGFRSYFQKLAADYIINTKTNLLIVLPTGLGKSMLIFLAAFADAQSSQLVLVPTISLQQDLTHRARESGLTVVTRLEEYRGESIILLTPEAARSSSSILLQLTLEKKISRIFIDEAHIVSIDTEWRSSLSEMPDLGILDLPTTLLTGTCPPDVASEIVQKFFTPSKYPIVIRQTTDRLNMEYVVKQKRSNINVVDIVMNELDQLDGINDKVIIFVPTQAETVLFANMLELNGVGASAYHSGMPLEERNANFLSWKTGERNVMVATSAFGVGIDDGSVRLVVMIGLPYSLLDYLQQSGRAGRDRKPARALLLYNEVEERRRIERANSMHGRDLLIDMLEYASKTNICRRRVLSRYVDGEESSCYNLEDCLYCDICAQHLEDIQDPVNLPHPDQVHGNQTQFNLFHPLRTPNNEVHVQVPPRTAVIPAIDLSHSRQLHAQNTPFGSKFLAQDRIYEQNARKSEARNLIDKFERCCGACLAAEKRFVLAHPNRCPQALGKCANCYHPQNLTGSHSAKTCPFARLKFSAKSSVCWSCCRPLEEIFHPTGPNSTTNCPNSQYIKDFFRFASARGNILTGLEKGQFDIDQFWPQFIEFLRTISS